MFFPDLMLYPELFKTQDTIDVSYVLPWKDLKSSLIQIKDIQYAKVIDHQTPTQAQKLLYEWYEGVINPLYTARKDAQETINRAIQAIERQVEAQKHTAEDPYLIKQQNIVDWLREEKVANGMTINYIPAENNFEFFLSKKPAKKIIRELLKQTHQVHEKANKKTLTFFPISHSNYNIRLLYIETNEERAFVRILANEKCYTFNHINETLTLNQFDIDELEGLENKLIRNYLYFLEPNLKREDVVSTSWIGSTNSKLIKARRGNGGFDTRTLNKAIFESQLNRYLGNVIGSKEIPGAPFSNHLRQVDSYGVSVLRKIVGAASHTIPIEDKIKDLALLQEASLTIPEDMQQTYNVPDFSKLTNDLEKKGLPIAIEKVYNWQLAYETGKKNISGKSIINGDALFNSIVQNGARTKKNMTIDLENLFCNANPAIMFAQIMIEYKLDQEKLEEIIDTYLELTAESEIHNLFVRNALEEKKEYSENHKFDGRAPYINNIQALQKIKSIPVSEKLKDAYKESAKAKIISELPALQVVTYLKELTYATKISEKEVDFIINSLGIKDNNQNELRLETPSSTDSLEEKIELSKLDEVKKGALHVQEIIKEHPSQYNTISKPKISSSVRNLIEDQRIEEALKQITYLSQTYLSKATNGKAQSLRNQSKILGTIIRELRKFQKKTVFEYSLDTKVVVRKITDKLGVEDIEFLPKEAAAPYKQGIKVMQESAKKRVHQLPIIYQYTKIKEELTDAEQNMIIARLVQCGLFSNFASYEELSDYLKKTQTFAEIYLAAGEHINKKQSLPIAQKYNIITEQQSKIIRVLDKSQEVTFQGTQFDKIIFQDLADVILERYAGRISKQKLHALEETYTQAIIAEKELKSSNISSAIHSSYLTLPSLYLENDMTEEDIGIIVTQMLIKNNMHNTANKMRAEKALANTQNASLFVTLGLLEHNAAQSNGLVYKIIDKLDIAADN